MKITIRRFFAFTLALMLMLAIASTASAATVYWTTSNGVSYYATVTKSGAWYNEFQPIHDATIVRHTYGSTSLVTWPTGSNASYEVSWPSTAGVYRNYLESALHQEGLSRTAQSSAPERDFYVIDADVPSGTYSYGMGITAYNVNWSVVRDSTQAPVGRSQENDVQSTTVASGTLIGAVSYATANKLIPAGT